LTKLSLEKHISISRKLSAKVAGRKTELTRTSILVLGMHRSGTSVLTRALSLMGANLPRNILGPGWGNEFGHWEPTALVHLHDQLLAEAGSAWDDWRAFDIASLPSHRIAHYKSEIARLVAEEYADTRLFVLKDPRICRFVSLYEEVFDGLKIDIAPVLIVRHPIEVAASLRSRNGIEPAQAYLYWLRHVLDSERATRGLARSFITYEDLLSNWRRSVGTIGERCAISWPSPVEEAAKDIDLFVSPQWRRHNHAEVASEPRAKPPTWVESAYAAMLSLHDEPRESMRALDAIAAEFDAASAAFGPALGAERARESQVAEESATAQAAFRQQIAALVDERAASEAQLHEQIAQRLRVESQVDALVNSRYWRMTRPLRKIEALLSRRDSGALQN
jgi:hypothetical protein